MTVDIYDEPYLFCRSCDDFTSRELCLCGEPCVLKFKDEFGDDHYYTLDHSKEIE